MPGFMMAATALLISMIPGAIAFYGMEHSFVIYYELAQGVLYAVFAWMLLAGWRSLSRQQLRRYFLILLGFGIAMRALILFAPPHSTDIYRYVWDGRVQAAGINPYRYVPIDAALSPLRDDSVYQNINRKEYAPTIYPPAAQIIYFVVSRVSETVTGMKAGMLAIEALAVWALVRLLEAQRLPIVLASLYLLHPLPVWEIAGSGHVDIAAVAFTLLSFLAAARNWRFASGAALAAGMLTKYFPLTVAPAIYKRWDWRMPLAFAITVAALYLPYLSVGGKVFGFIGGYAGEESWGGDGFFISALLRQAGFGSLALPVFLLLAAIILIALAWRTTFRADPERPGLGGGFAIAAAFTVLFSPHYPWYFLWLVPFLCFFPKPSVFWLTLAAPILYRSGWPLGLAGQSFLYIPFAILLAVENLRLAHKDSPHGHAIAR
jgi:hypothetical protein